MSPELKKFIRQNPDESSSANEMVGLLTMCMTDAIEAKNFDCIGHWANLAEEILQLCDEGELK